MNCLCLQPVAGGTHLNGIFISYNCHLISGIQHWRRVRFAAITNDCSAEYAHSKVRSQCCCVERLHIRGRWPKWINGIAEHGKVSEHIAEEKSHS